MCACRCRRGRGRSHGRILIASVGVSLPNLFLFRSFPFVPFVMPGLDPGIHAEASLAQCFPPALVGVTSVWTTASSAVRLLTVPWHSSGVKARRENDETHPPPCKRGRGTARSAVEGASCFKVHLHGGIIVEAAAPSPPFGWSPFPAIAGKDGMSAPRQRMNMV